MSVVYKAVNKANGKCYIGITCGYLSQRVGSHKYAAKKGSQTHFHRAIRKHGWGSFVFEKISEHSLYDEAKAEEIRLIAALFPEYNMTAGGDGCQGWRASDEQKRKNSESKKGLPGFWLGKKLPKHVCKMISERNLRLESREKWKKSSRLGPESIRRKVVCLNDGIAYDSIRSAAAAYNLNESSVNAVCRKHPVRKTVGGLVFRYYGEHHGGLEEAIKLRAIAKENQLRPLASGRAILHGAAP